MDRLLSDLTHSFRRLARAPAFALIVTLTLALGIGANTAIFSLIRTVLLQPLPYEQPERLVLIWSARDPGQRTWLSGPKVRSFGSEVASFEQVGGYIAATTNIVGTEDGEHVPSAGVTPNFFRVLGVRAAAGRVFAAEDGGGASQDVVILGHGLWQRRFGGDHGVIGETVRVQGLPRTVVGVLPAGFRLPLDYQDGRPTEVFIPLDLNSPALTSWGNHSIITVARLHDGALPGRATAEMQAVEARWLDEGLVSNLDGLPREAVPVADIVVGDVRPALWILAAAVGFVLLIACANVANLLLARADERQGEIAIRTAVGASRGRLMRLLLTESVVLSLAGGVAGAALAFGGLRLLVAIAPAGIPRVETAGLDGSALAFTLGLSLLTGMLFGLAPAFELSRPDLSRALKDGGRSGTVGRARQRFRDALAVAQVAFSVVLLVGASLLMRSFAELRRVDVGFTASDVLTLRAFLPPPDYPQAADVAGFYEQALARMRELPGVESAGAARLLPLTGTIGNWSITLDGRERVPGENPNGDWQVVTPGYFEAMGMRLVRGRFLSDTDRADTPLAAVISEAMAQQYWPNGDALGKRFHLGTAGQPWITVVGIASEVRHNAIVESPRAEMYIPHAQFGTAGGFPPRGMTFAIRTTSTPLGLVPYVREAMQALDPSVPLSDVRTLEHVTSEALAQERFTALLLTLFSALAATLAAIGIYGLIALLVSRRRQEIGIRIALGARATTVVTMVLRRGLWIAGAGVAVGIGVALLSTRTLSSMLYGVSAFDPVALGLVPLLLAGIAVMACLIPAMRAAAVDPAAALRQE